MLKSNNFTAKNKSCKKDERRRRCHDPCNPRRLNLTSLLLVQIISNIVLDSRPLSTFNYLFVALQEIYAFSFLWQSISFNMFGKIFVDNLLFICGPLLRYGSFTFLQRICKTDRQFQELEHEIGIKYCPRE